MWRDCDWPRFAGFSSKHPDTYGFKSLAPKVPSNWRKELSEHLDSLPPKIEYVLLTFEDALFTAPVDGSKLNAIADLIVREDLSYVNLLPVRRNFAGQVIEFFRRRLSKRPLRRLPIILHSDRRFGNAAIFSNCYDNRDLFGISNTSSPTNRIMRSGNRSSSKISSFPKENGVLGRRGCWLARASISRFRHAVFGRLVRDLESFGK